MLFWLPSLSKSEG